MPRRELEVIYRELFLPLVRRARFRHRLSAQDAHDLVHEAFVIALVKLTPDGNATAWFFKVVDRLALRFLQTCKRRGELLARWGPPIGSTEHGDTNDPEADEDNWEGTL